MLYDDGKNVRLLYELEVPMYPQVTLSIPFTKVQTACHATDSGGVGLLHEIKASSILTILSAASL